ncbi:hypothetical protein GQ44DRAFT_832384 [Phaeosphaeriaceae sp. PMI808]|nr:hypothetical protein GQ44DRAFT_832384 [Phaeosphaeriaceae sp. PMI808]
MKTLTELPEGLLYLVAETLQRDRCSLVALAQSCCSLHRAARSFIFRHIKQLSLSRTQLLERSLAADASLKTYVHSYPVHIEYGEILNNGLERSLEFSNLRELIFICPHKFRLPENTPPILYMVARGQSRGSDQDFQCGFLDTHPFDRIHSISLIGGFTGTEIMRFILLPAIQTVVAKDIASIRDPSLPSDLSLRTSSLTSLSLTGDGFWSIQPETLQAFFSACPFLQDLRCQIPVSARPDPPYEIRSSWVADAVSLAALNVTFASLRKSLRRFSLLQLRHNVPYDGTRMDLSQFENLIDLEITSCCLLPVGAPCAERDLLYKLLPTNLERLMLDFPRESGVFFHHLEGEPFLTQDPFEIPESRYLWILALLKQKDKYLKNLVRVTMQDPPGSVGFWHWNQIEWVAPKDVRQLMRASDVQLIVKMSYPDPKSEIESWNSRERRSRYGSFPWQSLYRPV